MSSATAFTVITRFRGGPRTVRRGFALLGAALCALCCATAAAQSEIPPADGLSWQRVDGTGTGLVAIRHAGDGSGRLFLVRQSGEIVIYDGSRVLDGVGDTPFLKIDNLTAGGERGLLGLAFHPNYAGNGLFYVNYTREDDGMLKTIVARYRVAAGDRNRADAASEQTVIEIKQDFGNHNGGHIEFGPDGYLYIGTGDGGSGGDPNRRAQDRSSLLGKMLRLDVDRAATDTSGLCGLNPNYAIPADNPFGGGDALFADGFEGGFGVAPAAAGASGCPEIWAYGLRNPWRWSFDRDGDMFIGDVGQGNQEQVGMEEISLLPAGRGGLNFGWRCFEAEQRFVSAADDPACAEPFVDPPVAPILSYSHDAGLGRSVTGGYRYRGAISGLDGVYIYGDFTSGRVWFAVPDGAGGWRSAPRMATGLSIASFGEDQDGELYLADYGSGDFYRLTAQ